MCFVDRANIGNARLAGLEKDLNLAGYDYNVVLTGESPYKPESDSTLLGLG